MLGGAGAAPGGGRFGKPGICGEGGGPRIEDGGAGGLIRRHGGEQIESALGGAVGGVAAGGQHPGKVESGLSDLLGDEGFGIDDGSGEISGGLASQRAFEEETRIIRGRSDLGCGGQDVEGPSWFLQLAPRTGQFDDQADLT